MDPLFLATAISVVYIWALHTKNWEKVVKSDAPIFLTVYERFLWKYMKPLIWILVSCDRREAPGSTGKHPQRREASGSVGQRSGIAEIS